MLAILFLIGSAGLGVCIVRRLIRSLLDGAEQILWGIVVGWTLTIVGVYLIARWRGELTGKLMIAATIATWVANAILIAVERRKPSGSQSILVWRRHYSGLALVLMVFTPVYWRLFSSHMFARGDGG